MNAKQLVKLLEESGWQEVRCSGSHRIFQHPDKNGSLPVPFHGSKDIPIGTLRKILKLSGLK
ncbi:type II toxin-antitoxin system HicA family toxin [Dyadobacter pollutisoli]|uniref:type II toxin-antitoxin system HicA family toxin n=1 Tax=Dyadobacter pollutisoli TaxID=2910158 RepID=UPI0035B58A69